MVFSLQKLLLLLVNIRTLEQCQTCNKVEQLSCSTLLRV